TKLSYALSEYYELSNRQATSCDFAGNATLVSTGPASAQAASAAASSCASSAPTGTTVPGAPTSTAPSTQGGTSTGTSSSSGNNTKSAAVGFPDARGALVTVVASVAGLAAGMFVLM
ncbi:hypothetical protein FRB90_010434, partial [Tulasnella sp. 427]